MSEEEKKPVEKTEQSEEKKEKKSRSKPAKKEKAETKEEKTETPEEKTETKEEKAEPKEEKVEETKPVVQEAPKIELPKFEKSIADKLENKFGQKTAIEFVKPTRIRVKVPKEDILDIARYIRDELHFDHAESVSGVDYPDQKEIEVVYHLGSYTDPELEKQVLSLATRTPREDNPNPGQDSTKLPSLRDIFYSVEFHERECFEMLGVFFEGHPDNRRLLLPEDWADLPPLRKDFRIKGR